MSTLTVNGLGSVWQASVTLALSGGDTAGATMMTIYRVVAGRETPVQAATWVPVQSGTWDDAEIPIGVPVFYRARFQGSSTVLTSAVVQLGEAGEEDTFPILSDPYRGLAVPVMVVAAQMRRTHASRASTVAVEGRADPVVIWDVEGAPVLDQLQFLTLTADAEAKVAAMCATGDPLLLRAPCPVVRSGWFQRAGDRVVERFSERSTTATRKHTITELVLLDSTWRPGVRPAGDTLGDVDRVAQPKTLQGITQIYVNGRPASTLLDIASAGLRDR